MDRKKEREMRALAAACKAERNPLPLPAGKWIPGERPDFQIESADGTLGVEVAELMPPPASESFNSPLAEYGQRETTMRTAERIYFSDRDASPVKVSASFWRVERSKNASRQVRVMAEGLAAFVRAHCHEADPVENFSWRSELPPGFGVIQIVAGPGAWGTWGYSGITPDGIKVQLGARIAEKETRLPGYRAKLPDSPLWLLLYSTWDMTRGVPMPHGIADWAFPSGFDRVFFYAAQNDCVEELRRA
jgi:hypothetical protein